MGARGPAPDSNVVRIKKGHKPLDVPQAVAAAPATPDWLPELAVAMWEQVSPELERLGLLGMIDLATLEAFCLCYAKWREHEAELAAEGSTSTGSMGQMVRHPAHDLALARVKELRQLAVQLGLTPAARQRMVRPKADVREETEAIRGRSPARRRSS
jgi:P27 family predicted phage terminase small subunit